MSIKPKEHVKVHLARSMSNKINFNVRTPSLIRHVSLVNVFYVNGIDIDIVIIIYGTRSIKVYTAKMKF